MVSKKKDSIGNKLSERTGLTKTNELRLVGFKPTHLGQKLSAGAHFISLGKQSNLANDEGWMSSVADSPTLQHSIGLGFIQNGFERLGEVVVAYDQLRNHSIHVEIVSPHFYDPEGGKQRG